MGVGCKLNPTFLNCSVKRPCEQGKMTTSASYAVEGWGQVTAGLVRRRGGTWNVAMGRNSKALWGVM